MTPRRKRLLLLLATGALLLAAGFFVKQAFRSNLVFYVTPSELAARASRPDEVLRVGGMVQRGSLQPATDGRLQVRFALTDAQHGVPVVFSGVLPDLFAEGKGAIVQGRLDASGTFVASEVLAKHDENYMPPKIEAAGASGAPDGGSAR